MVICKNVVHTIPQEFIEKVLRDFSQITQIVYPLIFDFTN